MISRMFLLLLVVAGGQLFASNPPDFRRYLMDDFCDACGCSASGGGMGFGSMIDANFAGIRYFNQSYSSRDGIFNDSPWIDENFNTVQLWGRIPLNEKIQLSLQVPYHVNNRKPSSGTQAIEGFGDITVLGLYTIYRTRTDSLNWKHTLQAGGGIKVPVGRYNSENNGSVNPSFQLGTGSWDYIAAAEYVVTHRGFGLNVMANYIFKTENDEQYRFGNQFNYAGTLFYKINREKFTIVPQAGLAGEVYTSNKQYGEKLPDTSGEILFGRLGVDAGKGRFSVGLNAMLPVSQNLTGGRVEANCRWAANLNYSL